MNYTGTLIRTTGGKEQWIYILGLVNGAMKPVFDIDMQAKMLGMEYGTLWQIFKNLNAKMNATGDGDYEMQFVYAFEEAEIKRLIEEMDPMLLQYKMAKEG